MENTVDMMAAQVQDDAALTTQENTQTLADVIGATPEQQPAEVATAETPHAEPGWMKKRIDAAVRKANSELEAKLRAEYDAQLAPLREAQLERDADKLVADGKIADRDMALEYLRATRGMQSAPEAPAKTVQRDDQGRFVSTKPDAAAQQKAAELVAQADTIFQSTGVDVMELYNTNPEIRQKVVNGEWSFVDVYKNTREAPAAPATPSPMRSANSMGIGQMDIRKMNSSQLAQLNAMLESGVKIDARK